MSCKTLFLFYIYIIIVCVCILYIMYISMIIFVHRLDCAFYYICWHALFICLCIQISRMHQLPVLPNLLRLNLSKNLLEEFPSTVSPDRNQALLPHLRYLNLQSNHISSIANQSTKLGDLEELIISKNSILKLPKKFLASLTSVKILDGSRNELSKSMCACTAGLCIVAWLDFW